MFGPIDTFLNGITMYRLVFMGLTILAIIAVIFGFLGFLPYGGFNLLISALVLCLLCYGSNYTISKLFGVQTNYESSWITGLILFFVLFPVTSASDIPFFLLAPIIAMASKYFLAINKKHIFNPTAVSVFIIGLMGSGLGVWWIATISMLPFVLVLGFLVLRKTQKFSLFFSFFITAILSIFVSFSGNGNILEIYKQILISWPIFFFGMIMLTEPLTSPPTLKLQMLYGAFVGILFGSQFHIGPFFSTPESVLVIGNVFSYIVSPKFRLTLTLKEKKNLAGETYEFSFLSDKKIRFKPGQYLEWTLRHQNTDSRGNRRYFTIASSPTEEEIKLGIKFYEGSSSFKKKLASLNPGDKIFASQLSGNFTLPKEKDKKLVFIAGGIGVTPFRSIIKDLLDRGERRDIVFFFSNKTSADLIYKDIFDSATRSLGIKVIYVVQNINGNESNSNIKVGYINADTIKSEAPDFEDRDFMISGPHSMVIAFEKTLHDIGVPKSNIKADFFPGYV